MLNAVSVEEDQLFPSPFREASPHVAMVVIHAAFLGVLGPLARKLSLERSEVWHEPEHGDGAAGTAIIFLLA